MIVDVLILMYNLTEYSGKYMKRPGSLCQYYTDEPANNKVDSKTFNFKSVFIDKTDDTGIVNIKIVIQIVVPVIFGKLL